MRSIRSHEGYMVIDNRLSEGIDDATMVALGYPVGAGKGLYESATYTCSHCHAVVVIEPKRTRERGFCRGCNRQLCDACNFIKSKSFECRSMERIIDEVLESAVRQPEASPRILLP